MGLQEIRSPFQGPTVEESFEHDGADPFCPPPALPLSHCRGGRHHGESIAQSW